MKNKVCIVVGIIFLIFALICPLPPLFGISWMAWRIIIGAFGCVSLTLGIYQTVKQ